MDEIRLASLALRASSSRLCTLLPHYLEASAARYRWRSNSALKFRGHRLIPTRRIILLGEFCKPTVSILDAVAAPLHEICSLGWNYTFSVPEPSPFRLHCGQIPSCSRLGIRVICGQYQPFCCVLYIFLDSNMLTAFPTTGEAAVPSSASQCPDSAWAEEAYFLISHDQ